MSGLREVAVPEQASAPVDSPVQQYRACNGASVRAKGVVRSGRLLLLEMTDQGGILGQD
jgi:hypothetical protein